MRLYRKISHLFSLSDLSDSTPPIAPEVAATEAPETKAGPSNLRLRVIWGLIGAALLLGSVWFSPWTFGLFFAFVQAVMLWEFYRMMKQAGTAPAVGIGLVCALLIFAVFHAGFNPQAYAALFAPDSGMQQALPVGLSPVLMYVTALSVTFIIVGLILPSILLLREMKRWKGQGPAFANVAVTLLGLLYVGVPIALLNGISHAPAGYDYRRVIVLLFLVWSADIGAYFSGKALGRHKLAPGISPGKTWEGWAGGALLTLAIGWALGYLIPEMPLTHRLVAAGVVAVFGPLGDLAESMLKRSVGMKDSGSIMPGHGGLLDRFDAFLLVLPILALLQMLAGQ